jgi:hypothetical protein
VPVWLYPLDRTENMEGRESTGAEDGRAELTATQEERDRFRQHEDNGMIHRTVDLTSFHERRG